MKLLIDNKTCVYNSHPNYDLYAANDNGNIIHTTKKIVLTGIKPVVICVKC